VDAAQFAHIHRVDARTVQRWCKAGEVPGAVKLPDGGWQIPPDAMRIKPLPGTDVTTTRRDDVGVAASTPTRRDDVGDTVAGALSVLPAFLTLEQASRLLGVPQPRIRENPERFKAEPVGRDHSLMVPAHVVREIAGLCCHQVAT
jgi:hypothetical protein